MLSDNGSCVTGQNTLLAYNIDKCCLKCQGQEHWYKNKMLIRGTDYRLLTAAVICAQGLKVYKLEERRREKNI